MWMKGLNGKRRRKQIASSCTVRDAIDERFFNIKLEEPITHLDPRRLLNPPRNVGGAKAFRLIEIFFDRLSHCTSRRQPVDLEAKAVLAALKGMV
jgi:hypothetical protein